MENQFINKMAKNINSIPKKPQRIVILGSEGFIAAAIKKKLKQEKFNFVSFGKNEVDLTQEVSVKKLNSLIQDDDTILFISAKAPVKNYKMFNDNIKICINVCNAIEDKIIDHLVYISSDAVYRDSNERLSEISCAEPDSLHGLMHLLREKLIRQFYKGSLCILRPTLIYGPSDPHNGYGPNMFIRKIINNENIELFGNGEELRDHIFIDDVSEVIFRTLHYKTEGVLNVVSGQVMSFDEIANIIVKCQENKVKILNLPRKIPMPHNGYREFSDSMALDLFKDFKFKKFKDIIDQIIIQY